MSLTLETKYNFGLREMLVTNLFLGVCSLAFGVRFDFGFFYLATVVIVLTRMTGKIDITDSVVHVDFGITGKDLLGINKLLGTNEMKLSDIAAVNVIARGRYWWPMDDKKFFSAYRGELQIVGKNSKKIKLPSIMFSPQQFKMLVEEIRKKNTKAVFDEGAVWLLKAPEEELLRKHFDVVSTGMWILNFMAMVLMGIGLLMKLRA